MKKVYEFLETPKEVIIAIERITDIRARATVEEAIIDKYLLKFYEQFKYVPKDCSDENILYEPCLGCGLCRETNPIQRRE